MRSSSTERSRAFRVSVTATLELGTRPNAMPTA